ncbi:helix-turn-helix domain-containing protein [Eubacteriales bacterium OttesenSCG-928-G02]|nr:helix-turn-helix domain-containing protein [Eubacteriales bacterium OttesenSCG-928-G02]
MLTVIEIGEKIAVARKLKNLSQSQLAGLMSVSAQAVGKWERGESMPDIITFVKLAEVLNVDLNYFSSTSSLPPDDAKPANEKAYKKSGWDMSVANWIDADFSGLSGLAEKFVGSNIDKCKFIGSDLSGLILKDNNIKHSDFADSNLSESKFQGTSFESNSFKGCDFNLCQFHGSSIQSGTLTEVVLKNTLFKNTALRKVDLTSAVFLGTIFRAAGFYELVFSGDIVNCSFESCTFTHIEFNNAVFCNTFFKNNNLKRVKFSCCKADKLSYAFLKSCNANIDGIAVID